MIIRALLCGIVIAMVAAPLRAQVVDSLAGYFPLAVGNVWQYHSRYAKSSIYGNPYTVVALGDTIMPNGRHYTHLSGGLFGGDAPMFMRYDSAEGAYYTYDPSVHTPSGEYKSYALREWLTPPNEWGHRDRRVAFGNSVDVLDFPSYSTNGYSFAYGIGLISAGIGWFDDIISYEYYDLVYAKIDGHEYGQFLSTPALTTDPATALEPGVPNPFTTATTIPFTLGHRDHVRLDVVSAVGEEVATLVDGELDAGSHMARLDGAGLPDGLYIVRLRVGGRTLTARVVLMR
jgi:hypothetical protein